MAHLHPKSFLKFLQEICLSSLVFSADTILYQFPNFLINSWLIFLYLANKRSYNEDEALNVEHTYI